MAYEVTTHPEAQDELDEALAWLDDQSLWSGGRMLTAYDATIGLIASRPESFRKVHLDCRRLNMSEFPFYIIFRVRGDSIFVLAVAHNKRHPDYWKHRIEDPT